MWLQQITRTVNQFAILGKLEAAISGVGDCAIRLQNLKRLVPQRPNLRHFRWQPCCPDPAFFSCNDPVPVPSMKPFGALVSLGLTSSLTNVLVQQIFEHSSIAFEAVCVDVRQVVGDHAHARFRAFNPVLTPTEASIVCPYPVRRLFSSGHLFSVSARSW